MAESSRGGATRRIVDVRAQTARGEAAIPFLIRSIADVHEDVRAAAIESLGMIGPAALPRLIQAIRELDGSRPIFSESLARAVQEFGVGARKSAPELAEIVLSSTSKPSRIAAAEALAGCWPGVADVLDTLIKALGDAPAPVFVAIVKTLSSIGAQAAPAAPALVKGLGDAEKRDAAVTALRRMGKGAVPAVASALAGPGAGVRQTAAQILAAIGDPHPDALVALRAALADGAPGVREAAALALAGLGTAAEQCRVELESATRDPDVKVRKSATVAIKKLDLLRGGGDPGPAAPK